MIEICMSVIAALLAIASGAQAQNTHVDSRGESVIAYGPSLDHADSCNHLCSKFEGYR